MKRAPLPKGHPSAPALLAPRAAAFLAKLDTSDTSDAGVWRGLPLIVRSAAARVGARRGALKRVTGNAETLALRGAFNAAEWAALIVAGFEFKPRSARGEFVTAVWQAGRA